MSPGTFHVTWELLSLCHRCTVLFSATAKLPQRAPGPSASWSPGKAATEAGFGCHRFNLIPSRIYGQTYSLALKKWGVTHGESHKSLSYRKIRRLVYYKPLQTTLWGFCFSWLLWNSRGSREYTITKERNSKGYKVFQIQCFPKELLYLCFRSSRGNDSLVRNPALQFI